MTVRLLEQHRAHEAMARISELGDVPKTYQSRAQSLPSMIQNLGLASTIAFLCSKDDTDRLLANHLAQWLLDDRAEIPWPPAALAGSVAPDRKAQQLAAALCWDRNNTKTSWLVYRQATHEARLFAGWLKRWSKASQQPGS